MRYLLWIPVFLPLIVLSQQRVFTIKPVLGINACQIHGDSYSGFDKVGLYSGIVLNARLKANHSLETGFVFSQKGARHNPNPKAGDYSFYRVNLNYLESPINYRFMVNERYFLVGGFSFAYLLGYTEDTELGNWNGVHPFEKFEWSLNAGLGFEYSKQFAIEIRTNNSLNPIRNYGRIANLVFYPNPVARFFNKGLYSNLLTIVVSYRIWKE